MIPKIGDIVDINPMFKKAYENKLQRVISGDFYGELEDGHIHIRNVNSPNPNLYNIILDHGSYTLNNKGYPLYFDDLYPFGWPKDAPLFVPLEQIAISKTLDTATLKEANTKPNAIKCVACGGKLKDPMMGPMFKHCPKCEP